MVDGGTRIEVDVEITNRNDDAQRIDSTQWTLVNPRVQTVEAVSATLPVTDLPGGETVSAAIRFPIVPGESGEFYIQCKPKTLDAARGIWQLVVP